MVQQARHHSVISANVARLRGDARGDIKTGSSFLETSCHSETNDFACRLIKSKDPDATFQPRGSPQVSRLGS